MDMDDINFDGVQPFQKKRYDEELSQYVDSLFQDIDNISPEEMKKKREFNSLFEQYLSLFRKTIDDDLSGIVPVDFSISDAMDKKIEILKDCIEKGITIRDSKVYPTILEGYVEENYKKGL